MSILDAAKNGDHGLSVMEESFDFKDIPFNFVAMIVFESKVKAKAKDGSVCNIGDRIRVVSDKVPTIDDTGAINIHGANINCIDGKFFTYNGEPAQGETLNRVAKVVEVHLRYAK